MDAHKVRSEADIKKRSVRRELARMLFFVAVRGQEIGAVGRAVEGDFTLGTTTDRADGFGFCRAEAARFAFLTDRTGQAFPLE